MTRDPLSPEQRGTLKNHRELLQIARFNNIPTVSVEVADSLIEIIDHLTARCAESANKVKCLKLENAGLRSHIDEIGAVGFASAEKKKYSEAELRAEFETGISSYLLATDNYGNYEESVQYAYEHFIRCARFLGMLDESKGGDG